MYLADSHVVLWMADDDRRLGTQMRSILQSDTTKFVSAASVLELTIKLLNGGLVVPRGIEALVEPQGFTPLPVTIEHSSAIAAFPVLKRHDPFDRILLAQAKVEGLTFLTADRRLLTLGFDWIVDATA
ncbi:MAG: hypothetical protein JWR83_211 [Aeromicrobium sp.]|nr:hypothetical protein [Aeromicrobium sp.]